MKSSSEKVHARDGEYYVICDVCGKKIRARNAVLIKDKYNLLNNMLVCKKDADKTNPQQYIKSFKERQIADPRMIRSEGTDQFVFISSASEIETGDLTDPTGRSPGVPRNLESIGATSTTINLHWFGPEDTGSSAIQGYKIERESPVGGGFSTVTANTNSVATTYTDTGLTANTVYNYRVSAVNDYTTGSTSNEASKTTSAS